MIDKKKKKLTSSKKTSKKYYTPPVPLLGTPLSQWKKKIKTNLISIFK